MRLYQFDWGWGMKHAVRLAAPDTQFDETRASVFKRYAESEFVVHNYLGTSRLETLAMNIPTNCFFDPDTYAFRPEAQPYLNALEQVGILHHSGGDAARFALSLRRHVAGWWNKPDVQNARSNFVARYANFSPDWPRQWTEEFERLVDGGVRH